MNVWSWSDAVQAVWQNLINCKLGLMKGRHIKEFWMDFLMLLSNQISVLASWLMFDLHCYCRMATVLQPLFPFSCCAVTVICYFKLPHSQKHTNTHSHYSKKMMEVFAKITLWFKSCFLQSWNWLLYSHLSADFRLHKSDSDICSEWRCLSLFLAFCFYVNFYCQNKLEMFDSCMCLTCTNHNSLNFCKSFVPLLYTSPLWLWAESRF